MSLMRSRPCLVLLSLTMLVLCAGSVEALVSFALAWTGIPLAKGVLAVCAYRIFNLWLPLLPAAIGLRHLKRWRDLAEAG